MPFLVWESPEGRNVRELDRSLVVIGRDQGSDLVLDHVTVSRRHALLQVAGGVKVTDLRSTAGTRINGARLTPDLPCTLEPGDFLQVGKVVLSFHSAPPPPAPPAPATQPPPTAPARPSRSTHVLIGIAFAAVAAIATMLAIPRDEPAPPPPAEAPAPAPAAQPPPPVPEEKPTPAMVAEPEPPRAPERERAAAGELPPAAVGAELPDLIEVDGKTRLAVRVMAIGERVEVVGADGRIYEIPGARVTRIEDRADLAKRVAVARRRLAPHDVAGRVELAAWCLDRLLAGEARALVREALSLAPEDKAARALDARLLEPR